VQHLTLAMLKEMLFTLDLAVDTGTDADRAAANRLQRKCALLAPIPLLLFNTLKSADVILQKQEHRVNTCARQSALAADLGSSMAVPNH